MSTEFSPPPAGGRADAGAITGETGTDVAAVAADAVVVFLAEGGVGTGAARAVDAATGGLLSRLATAGEDGAVVLWDVASGSEVRSIAAHDGAATCVAFSRDGGTLASGGSDKLVKLWNPADGVERRSVRWSVPLGGIP
jgi:hypothetical protein